MNGNTTAEIGFPDSSLSGLAGRLRCPVTGKPLALAGDRLVTADGGRSYAIADGIPNLFAFDDAMPEDRDVTELVKEFYEETPFPNYDDIDTRHSLAEKARRGMFADLLDRQLPDDVAVLEAGCGTGQLTNFLGQSWRRRVVGGDICANSLRLAEGFRRRNRIVNAGFVQMNIFRPPFDDASFDVIVSNGVLHHTADARRAFLSLVPKLRPGGYFLVGLYNSYARLPTLWRRRLFEIFGPSLHFLDPRLIARKNRDRIRAWYMDQYRHPHETKHSMDEVLGWFEEADIDFVSGIPHLDGSDFVRTDKMFEAHARGTAIKRACTQIAMLLSGGSDGGLFIMIGRRRA